MRNFFLMVVVFVVIETGCKKEMTTRNERIPQSSAQADVGLPPPVCSEEHWANISAYPTIRQAVAYNNKLYAPDPLNNTMKIFDGVNWTSKPSNLPQFMGLGNPFEDHPDWGIFTIGNKGYFFDPGDPESGLWEYNFAQNSWTRKFDFTGRSRFNPACFSIGDKGYMVGGWFDLDTYTSQAWEYDQSQDRWFQIPNLSGPGIASAVGFSINNKGYIMGGRSLNGGTEIYRRELFEYDPSTAHWTTRAPLPGPFRENATAFVIGNRAYVGGGDSFTGGPGYNEFDDFYKYNPANDSWVQIASLPGPLTITTFFGFSLNSIGYCTGYIPNGSDSVHNRIYKYFPQVCSL